MTRNSILIILEAKTLKAFTQIKNTHRASLDEKLPAIDWIRKLLKKWILFAPGNALEVFVLETVSPEKVFIQSWVTAKDIWHIELKREEKNETYS